MTLKRIRQLAEFFYSSDNIADVPLRISCIMGRYAGFDLEQQDFIELFVILSKSNNLKKDLSSFVRRRHE